MYFNYTERLLILNSAAKNVPTINSFIEFYLRFWFVNVNTKFEKRNFQLPIVNKNLLYRPGRSDYLCKPVYGSTTATLVIS